MCQKSFINLDTREMSTRANERKGAIVDFRCAAAIREKRVLRTGV